MTHSMLLAANADHVLVLDGGRIVDKPAFAAYLRGHDGVHRAHAVQVLTVSASGIARVVSFNQPELLATFGMAQTLSSAAAAAGQRR